MKEIGGDDKLEDTGKVFTMTIAFIPLRGGSKSIPKKNIKELNGKPLCYWVIKSASEAEGVDEVIISTDCDEITTVVNGLNLPRVSVIKRSEQTASDTASTESVMLEYLEQTKKNNDEKFILLQATSPLTTSHDIQECLQLSEKYDSVLSCVRSKRFYWNQDGTPINYDFKNRPRRQDFDGYLMENGAIYVSTVKRILESKNRLSGNVGIYEMPEITGYEIDEPEDWIILEGLINKS